MNPNQKLIASAAKKERARLERLLASLGVPPAGPDEALADALADQIERLDATVAFMRQPAGNQPAR